MNFLSLVNDMAARLNEVPLDSTNFATTGAHYTNMKNAVNAAIQHINQDNFEWPFYFVSYEETLVPGQARYPYQTGTKWANFNTFRLKRDDSLNVETKRLMEMDYEQYLDHCIDDEYNTDTSIREVPLRVSRAPNEEYVLSPVPDKAYTVVYEYYSKAVDLVDFDDTTPLPDDFRHIIVDGAMYYKHIFNSDYEAADRTFAKFNEGLKNMRKNYSNRYEYVRDTRIMRNNYSYLNPTRISN